VKVLIVALGTMKKGLDQNIQLLPVALPQSFDLLLRSELTRRSIPDEK
jgi:hypothetical protein